MYVACAFEDNWYEIEIICRRYFPVRRLLILMVYISLLGAEKEVIDIELTTTWFSLWNL